MVDPNADLRFTSRRLVSDHRRGVKLQEHAALDPPAFPLAVNALGALLRQHLRLELVYVALVEERTPADRRRRLHRERRVDVLDLALLHQLLQPSEREADRRHRDRDPSTLAQHARRELRPDRFGRRFIDQHVVDRRASERERALVDCTDAQH